LAVISTDETWPLAARRSSGAFAALAEDLTNVQGDGSRCKARSMGSELASMVANAHDNLRRLSEAKAPSGPS